MTFFNSAFFLFLFFIGPTFFLIYLSIYIFFIFIFILLALIIYNTNATYYTNLQLQY